MSERNISDIPDSDMFDRLKGDIQEKVAVSTLPVNIQRLLKNIIEISKGGFPYFGGRLSFLQRYREVGAIVIVADDNKIYSGIFTSNLQSALLSEDVKKATQGIANKVLSEQKIKRIILYHTHPPSKIYDQRTLSLGDLQEALKMAEWITTDLGINASFEIFAIALQDPNFVYGTSASSIKL